MPTKKPKSLQPRFTEKQAEGVYYTLMEWVNALEAAPEYKPDTRIRDTWLSDFWKLEPHLAGVVHSMVSIDANRGWTLTGGRNQVLRYTEVLHDWMVAFGLRGWRPGVAAMATGFYVTDMGGLAEVGRDGDNGPTRQFFHLDPTKCYLSGNQEYPVYYQPRGGRYHKAIKYREMDMMRVASMPEIKEEFRGAGRCFLSRAEILIRLMIAVWQHDMETLGAKAPRGLLLITGISEQQWKQAMDGNRAEREGKHLEYYEAVDVIAGNTGADLKLVALSSLPHNFSLQEWVNMFMYGLAEIAGFDASEFYPVQFGALGRGTEMEVQHEKATGKGGRNFALALQEQLQRPDILPESLHYEMEERDEAAEIEAAAVMTAWATAFKTIRETGMVGQNSEGAITTEETRLMLADKDIIPAEWTDTEMADTATDENEAGEEGLEDAEPDTEPEAEPVVESSRNRRIRRDRLLAKPHIWRTIYRFPHEPLVRYRWFGNKPDKIEQLWSSGAELIQRMIQPVLRLKRQDDSEILYKSGNVLITADMVDKAIQEGGKRVGAEFEQLLDNEPIA